jgi:hypothetical protein
VRRGTWFYQGRQLYLAVFAHILNLSRGFHFTPMR